MANRITEQRLKDTTKDAILKYTLVGDGTALANTLLIDVSTLAYAKNTTGGILESNANNMKQIYKTSIKRITGQIGGPAGTGIKLKWHRITALPEAEVVVLGPGDFNIDFDAAGYTCAISNPDTTPANSNGDIIITNAGATPNTMTMVVVLKKDNEDYDAGQTADPMAFNRGVRGI